MEVGVYVRTPKGIAKITSMYAEPNQYIVYTDNKNIVFEYYLTNEGKWVADYVKKASHNIIDLIEVGDYVNGSEVVFKDFNNLNEECLECGIGDYIVCSYEAKDIKSIVTKEQFESMSYKVEE